MKISVILAVGCLLASAPCSHAQEAPAVAAVGDAVAAPLTAAQILEKSRQTYAEFSVYEGSCNVVSDIVMSQGDAKPTQEISSASAQIEFVRGKYLTVRGVDSGGALYKAHWNPGKASIESVRSSLGAGFVNAGEISRTDYKDEVITAEDAMVGGLTGMTRGTGSILPAVLRNGIWSNPLRTGEGQLQLLPARNLGATPCYVVVATMPEINAVNTYWIEQKTFLLRRLTQEQGEQRYDDMPKTDGVEEPTLRVAYSLNHYVFATTEAK